MSGTPHDTLLSRYYDELAYLRRMGAAFAGKYPQVASRLELGRDECPDPHVERLIESFALLTARIQHTVDAGVPEIASALLDVLYPHYLAPVPSMTVARFEVDPAQALTTPYRIEKHTPVFALAADDLRCRFRTCYPVDLWPLEVAEAVLEAPKAGTLPGSAPAPERVLRIRLEGNGLEKLETEGRKLRFYLNGTPDVQAALYELLFAHTVNVAIRPKGAKEAVLLGAEALAPVGLGAEEEVLPYPRHAHPGYRLLQEYFALPQKFFFFDVGGLEGRLSGSGFELLFLLDGLPARLPRVHARDFVLGCTPVLNLFPRVTEPLRLDHRRTEYCLVPDMRLPRTTEIHSIQEVFATSDLDGHAPGRTRAYEPFYAFTHGAAQRGEKAFWHARRVPTERREVPGTEVWLSFRDEAFRPAQPPSQTVYARTLCTNRRLAEQLPEGYPLQIEQDAPVKGITALHQPTTQLDPPLGGEAQWRLISHLSLNHLSLTGGEEGLKALREILSLYGDFARTSVSDQIQGITKMRCAPARARLGRGAMQGFCRGTKIEITFDEERFEGASAFLLGSVLNRFFGLYAAINSFTELEVRSAQRDGTWKKWKPIAGVHDLL